MARERASEARLKAQDAFSFRLRETAAEMAEPRAVACLIRSRLFSCPEAPLPRGPRDPPGDKPYIKGGRGIESACGRRNNLPVP